MSYLSNDAPVLIRRYRPKDWSAAWAILEPVFRAGETFAVPTDISEVSARNYWTSPPKTTFVAVDDDGLIVGTYTWQPHCELWLHRVRGRPQQGCRLGDVRTLTGRRSPAWPPRNAVQLGRLDQCRRREALAAARIRDDSPGSVQSSDARLRGRAEAPATGAH